MDFRSNPYLKPTEIQPPTIEQRTPSVLARKLDTRARLRRALREGGTIALKGSMLVLIPLKNRGVPDQVVVARQTNIAGDRIFDHVLHWCRGYLGLAIL